MALIDRIQNTLAAAGSTPVGTTDQTARARQLLAAKSGKQVSPAALAPQSAIAEAAAVDQTTQAAQAVGDAGRLAAAGVAQQAQQLGMQESGARADLALRSKQQQQANTTRRNQLLADLRRDRSSLNLDRDHSRLEQLAHTMRMGDRQYVDQLEMQGQRQRLDNELSFKEAMQRSIFGSNHDLLVQSLRNQNIFNASERDFAEMLGRIDLNYALQMAANEAADARQAAYISGATGIATAGVGAYGSYADKKTDTPKGNTASTGSGTQAAPGTPGSTLHGPPTAANDPNYWKYD